MTVYMMTMTISMGKCAKDVTPLLMHVFLALTRRYDRENISKLFDECGIVVEDFAKSMREKQFFQQLGNLRFGVP